MPIRITNHELSQVQVTSNSFNELRQWTLYNVVCSFYTTSSIYSL